MKKFDVDILVCGGGSAGVAAAVHAARGGARTMIIEQLGSFGGLMTNDYVTGLAGDVSGFGKEFVDRLKEKGWVCYSMHDAIDPEKGKFMLEQMLMEAGVRILYFTTIVNVVKDGNRIKSAVCHSKGGLFEIDAEIFIDATGDGDLADYAGCAYESGGSQFGGYNISSSMAFRLANVNLLKYREASIAWSKSEKKIGHSLTFDLFTEALKNGDMPRYVFPGFLAYKVPNTPDDSADVTIDLCHSYQCRNLDPEDVTRQALEQHRQMQMLEIVLRKYFPGYENSRLTGIASLPGMRETRRIIGGYILTDMDVLLGKKFEDGITRVTDTLCNHHPTSGRFGFIAHKDLEEPVAPAVCRPAQCNNWEMHPYMEGRGFEARNNQQTYCEIPYRCLVPKKVDNILTAGRCISTEFQAQIAPRLIGPSFCLGHAAGVAASMCIKKGIIPRALDGREVRKFLNDDTKTGIPMDTPIERKVPKELIYHGEQLRASY